MASFLDNLLQKTIFGRSGAGSLGDTLKTITKASQTTKTNGGGGFRGETNVMDTLSGYNTDFTNSDAYKSLQSYANSLGAGASPIDLSGIIADYNRNNQATIANYNKTLADTISTLKSSNEQSRNDLLTSLKRFQESTADSKNELLTSLNRFRESNAESMRTQQQDFNASRATLEDESFMNQRNSLANAASRGLGGSGLQQLAQLQNRLAASKSVSTLAQKNQNVQDALRKALTQEQEDYNTKVSKLDKALLQQQEDYKTGVTKLEKELAAAITKAQNDTAAQINAANTNTTNIINNLKYNEAVRQQQAAAQASSAKSSLNSLLSGMKEGVTRLQGAETALNSALENTINSYLSSKGKSSVSQLSSKQKKELLNNLTDSNKNNISLNSIYNNYVNAISDGDIAASYGLDNSYTNNALSNLNTIYNYYTNLLK